MKVLVINGSPRGKSGNTHAITQEFMRGAEKAGAIAEYVFLAEKKIQFCRGCFSCWIKTPGKCIIKDDAAPLLEKIVEADVLVVATPLYVDNVSAMTKNFFDRMIPLANPHFDKDNESGECRHRATSGRTVLKKLVVISNSGFPEQSHFQVLRLLFRRLSRNLGAELVGEIYRGAGELFSMDSIVVSVVLRPYKRLLKKAGQELVLLGRISEQTQAELEKPLMSDDRYIRGANKYWDKMLKQRDQ